VGLVSMGRRVLICRRNWTWSELLERERESVLDPFFFFFLRKFFNFGS